MFLEMISLESGLPLEFYRRFPGLGETESGICYSIYRAEIKAPLNDEDKKFLAENKPLIIDFQTYERPVTHR